MSEATRDDVEVMVSILSDPSRRHRWIQADEIGKAAADGTPPKPWHRRRVADTADAAAGRILSTTLGYKLQDFATDEDVQRAYARLTDMAAAIAERATAIMRHFHARQRRTVSGIHDQPGQPDLFTPR